MELFWLCGIMLDRTEGRNHGGHESVLELPRGAQDHALLGASGELGVCRRGKLFVCGEIDSDLLFSFPGLIWESGQGCAFQEIVKS
jgi:hypothetical protein